MSLTISLSTEAEAKLKERADAAGTDVARYVEGLIARELVAPLSLLEAAEPFARAVEASGASDEEFAATLSQALEASRKDRRNRGRS